MIKTFIIILFIISIIEIFKYFLKKKSHTIKHKNYYIEFKYNKRNKTWGWLIRNKNTNKILYRFESESFLKFVKKSHTIIDNL
jgi:hypothetical protein